MLNNITDRYGKERRTWIMDRGIPTEGTLAQMRHTNLTATDGREVRMHSRLIPPRQQL